MSQPETSYIAAQPATAIHLIPPHAPFLRRFYRIGLRALCGMPIEERDCFEWEAADRVWARGPRCRNCEALR